MVRFLVVDDHQPWRFFVCSAVRKRPELEIVGKAANGEEAVRKTVELHPDNGSTAVRMSLKDDDPIMSGHESLAKRLCQVSPYARRIGPLIGLIPEIMERNDQLRPLWTAWRQNATPDLTPRRYFTRDEIKVLRDFLKYLYFASDAFARSARRGR